MRYNLENRVTPNHFKVEDFEAFEKLSIDEEFDLVAALHIFYHADMRFESKANAARRKLKRLGHPLADVADDEPSACRRRYNALMMAIADSEIPGIESYIDTWGAFSFRVPGDSTVLCGDAAYSFAFYTSAAAVRERLQQAMALA